jgi:hypothetical protein
MKALAIAATGVAVVFAAPVFAQSGTASDSGLRMPYQKDFWTTGHVGGSIGRSSFKASCPAGADCDDSATAAKLFAGGRFNNTFGGEVTFLHSGDFNRSTGDVSVQAVNFGLLAGIPFGVGMNSSIFGKLGVFWDHAEVGSLSQNGWGPSVGVGALIGINRSWAVRLDWDRWRFKMPGAGGDRENFDTLLIGAQYTFGNPR